MSHTDHHGASPRYMRYDGEYVHGISHNVARRYHKAMSARAMIAEQLRDDSPVYAIVERTKPRKEPKPQPVKVTVQHYTPRNTRMSATRLGTRYEGIQGKLRPSDGFVPYVGRKGTYHSVIDVPAPSILAMARARAAKLGLAR